MCGGDDCVLGRPLQSLSPVPTTSQCAEALTDVSAPRMSGRLGDCCEEDVDTTTPANNIVPLCSH